MTAKREHYTSRQGEERGKVSCERVIKMFIERPWVVGVITETEKNCDEDQEGIDLYVPVDTRLTDILCMEQGSKGVMVQVKSSLKRENEFKRGHKSKIMNLASGQNIFVLNGQEEASLILGSLIGQIVAFAGLTGSVPEDLMLGFMAEEMHDPHAVEAYIENRQEIIEDKWFGDWIRGVKFTHGSKKHQVI